MSYITFTVISRLLQFCFNGYIIHIVDSGTIWFSLRPQKKLDFYLCFTRSIWWPKDLKITVGEYCSGEANLPRKPNTFFSNVLQNTK